jgi:uncharacterized membrane protein YqiK
MDKQFASLLAYWPIAVLIVAALCYKLFLRVFGVLIIPQDRIGIVNKKYVLFGNNKTLPGGAIIALKGEAGLQADTLPPGAHFFLWPWQYSVQLVPFVVVPPGQVGVVESRDGAPLEAGRVLGSHVDCESFQNARKFLTTGGKRGPQISIIPPGTYRINTALFSVDMEQVIEIPDNKIGIVTTKEGAPLSGGEIAGRKVEGHQLFQDAQSFVDNGGFKGRQEDVLLAGTYFINPLFANVEMADLTSVPIANVGVVIAYVGTEGKDVSGDQFKHGNLVARGEKGVWVSPLDPGKYPINPFTHKVELVPTANVVLNWADAKTESHKLDANLSTITVRSSDGFKFNLDVSQIIHIPHNDAPKVIARFGSITNLVTQVLEPTIGNYFRNAAQNSDVISFLKERTKRQQEAKDAIGSVLKEYDVNAVDTLIGDITPPEDLMKTLTDRKLAEQEQVTYKTQQEAEDVRRQLQQARAMADTQATVVAAERKVQIAEFDAQSMVKAADGAGKSKVIQAKAQAESNIATAEGDATARVTNAKAEAESKKAIANADAEVTRVNGEAEAGKVLAIGDAEATVIKKKIDSMEAGKYAVIEVAKALAAGDHELVPRIMAGGNNGGGGNGTLVDVLLAGLIKDEKGAA